MKSTLLLIFTGTLFGFISTAQAPCQPDVALNVHHSRQPRLDSLMQKFTPDLAPGIVMVMNTAEEGWWMQARGYAKVENKTPMTGCELQYLQSVSKMYMAVEILQLKEQGKIELDAPMTKYLPAKYARFITGADKVTVRMLLNHRSGIAEYNEDPGFISYFIEHPLRVWSAEDCLKSIAGKTPIFEPGTKYKYINTNYLLLALIGDALTGDHAAYIVEHIFKPLGLNNSYYANNDHYLKALRLPDSYWDAFNIGTPVNITHMQQATVVATKGDDGIVCTPVDVIKFMKGLMEGKLLNAASMAEMLNFVTDEKGNKRYGMGMIYYDLGGVPAYGHGGGGMGAGCQLLYIPSRKTYFFFATNLGVFVESDLVKKIGGMFESMLQLLVAS